jgi:hypothetical protein
MRDDAMNTERASEYDVIVIGSGTCGASVARELSRQDKKVLVVEQGADVPLRETMSGIAAVGRDFRVGESLKATTAMTVGGSTSLYFSVCKLPTPETFSRIGLDLSAEYEQVRRELPIAELPDEFLAPQTLRVRESAGQLGYPMKKNLMLVDQSKCQGGGYSYDAKWKAKSYITDAVASGATLRSGAQVQKVLVENGKAIGVEYTHKAGMFKSERRRAFAGKVVLSAGALATPKLLMDCGIDNVGDRGFFCKPAYMVCGRVPGLRGKEAFLGYLDIDLGNGVYLGDGTMNASLFKLVMLSNMRVRHMFAHPETVAVGILINDSMGGEIRRDGQYRKQLTPLEHQKLAQAEAIARRILQNAGARNLFTTRLVAGIPGGALRHGVHFDDNMETPVRNLHVCDHSVISDVRITPTVTLISLGRYLARRLVH